MADQMLRKRGKLNVCVRLGVFVFVEANVEFSMEGIRTENHMLSSGCDVNDQT